MNYQLMDKNHVRELLPVLQAFVDGKKVQELDPWSNAWVTVPPDGPLEWLYTRKLRICPEPRRMWLNEYDNIGGNGGCNLRYAYVSEEDALANRGAGHIRAVEFVEVVK